MSRKITDLEKQWFLCSMDGQIDDMKNLLKKDPHLAAKKDFIMGFTALHWAARNGRYEMVDFLLELGVDICSKTNGGYTPLHLATMYNHNNVVLLLVENYDASVDVRDHSGKKPKDYLHHNAMPSVKDKLQKRDLNNKKKNEDKPMSNISNMFREMCLITPPQLDVCKEDGNAFLLSPLCLPPKPEVKTVKTKNPVRRSYTTFRKARPKLRKPTRDDEDYEVQKMKIGPPLPLKDNYFLDFSRIPRNERARSEPDFGRVIQEWKLKIEEN